ncbi:MAG TPA: Mut7-C RNAse domain-containing protein [Pirellulales bacterium]|nr:Mut7-C RNAse domain-containing protein [Pirellulales bacterium]
MMNEEVYDRAEQLFRGLLWRIRQQPLEAAVAAFVEELRLATAVQTSADEALEKLYRRVRGQVLEQLAGTAGARRRRMLETLISPLPPPLGFDFHCDAGLGGLSRWLRAAGYDAAFWPDIDDDDLLRKMIGSGGILLSSDTRLFDRGVLASGAVAGLLVPVSLTKRQQLAFVRAELDLPLKPPRCMACGGRFIKVDKESVRERIPPRTYPWLDDYYLCRRCQRLFWKGTHWQRIATALGR